LFAGFEKAYQHSLAKIKGQKGGKAKAEKKSKPQPGREERTRESTNGSKSIGARQKRLGSQKRGTFRKKSLTPSYF
jgi:hypothetical protein